MPRAVGSAGVAPASAAPSGRFVPDDDDVGIVGRRPRAIQIWRQWAIVKRTRCLKVGSRDRETDARPSRATHQTREQLERLKQESTWRSSDRNAITLTKEPHLRVVLIAMKTGARLHEHQATGPVTIQAVSGLLRLSVGNQILKVKPGEVVLLESAIEHGVEALEENGLLLTLVKLP